MDFPIEWGMTPFCHSCDPSVIPATERESSGVKEGVLWIPRHAGNDRKRERQKRGMTKTKIASR